MTRYLSAVGPRALAASLLLSGALAGGATAQNTLSTTLSGPGFGNGTASVTLDAGAGSVCYNVLVNLDPPATAAHIHRGAAGSNGPVVVPFELASSDSASGCAQGVDAALIQEMMTAPAAFYVNVHNSAFPAGALRGQLGQ